MSPEVWNLIGEERYAAAHALLSSDLALLASRDGQLALGYVLACLEQFAQAREVHRRLRRAVRERF